MALEWSLVVQHTPHTKEDPAAQARDVADVYALLLAGLALLLALTVEFVYLRDLFGTRMNTVFKLYYQTWILLALASAYGLGRIAGSSAPIWLKAPALGFAGLLIVAGMLYPLAATPNKANQFRGEPTLDGLAFMRLSQPSDDGDRMDSRQRQSGGCGRVERWVIQLRRCRAVHGDRNLHCWDGTFMRCSGGDAYGEMVAGCPRRSIDLPPLPPEELLLARWDPTSSYGRSGASASG
jgi:hypothetical protein